MYKVVNKIKIKNKYVISIDGDVDEIEIGDVIELEGSTYKIESRAMVRYINPEDCKTKAEVLAVKL